MLLFSRLSSISRICFTMHFRFIYNAQLANTNINMQYQMRCHCLICPQYFSREHFRIGLTLRIYSNLTCYWFSSNTYYLIRLCLYLGALRAFYYLHVCKRRFTINLKVWIKSISSIKYRLCEWSYCLTNRTCFV